MADLGHLCRASGVGAHVQRDNLPRSRQVSELDAAGNDFAANGGEDYELLVVLPRAMDTELAKLAGQCSTSLSVIGRTTNATGQVALTDTNGRPYELKRRGFDHFAREDSWIPDDSMALLALAGAAIACGLLASIVATSETALLSNLRLPSENDDPPAVRDARAFPRAALTSLWLCRDATLALAATFGLLIDSQTPAVAALLVFSTWVVSLLARKRAKRRKVPMRGAAWRVVGQLLPMARALRVFGHDVARRQAPHRSIDSATAMRKTQPGRTN